MIGLRLHCDDIVLRCAADGFAGVVLGCLLSDDGRLLIKVELMEQQRANVWAQTAQQEFGFVREVSLPIAWRRLENGRIFDVQPIILARGDKR